LTIPRTLLGLVVALAAALPEAVQAHALLVRTSPPKRAVLRDAPRQIELWFNERLEPAFANASVSDGAGQAVSKARAAVVGDERKRLSLDLPPLPPGTYTVRFRVLSVDGHVAEESFAFSVRKAP
jgi:methionine-rich copper-binding protein CopC